MFTWRKKVAVIISLIVVCMIAGMSVSVSTIGVCGCGSINGWVWSDVKMLDTRIGQYAAAHNGLYPSYEEAAALYAKVEPEDYAPEITPNIDVVTGDLKATNDGKMIAYGISNDRRTYILRGIGKSQKFGHFVFFGWDLGVHGIGYDYPVFKPGDPDPDR